VPTSYREKSYWLSYGNIRFIVREQQLD